MYPLLISMLFVFRLIPPILYMVEDLVIEAYQPYDILAWTEVLHLNQVHPDDTRFVFAGSIA